MPNCVSGNWYEYWVRPEVHSLFEVNQLKRFIAKSQLYPCWSSFWRSVANYFSCCCAWTRKLHLALFMWNCCVMDSFSGYRFTVIFCFGCLMILCRFDALHVFSLPLYILSLDQFHCFSSLITAPFGPRPWNMLMFSPLSLFLTLTQT